MSLEQLLAAVKKYHSQTPGCWLRTDRAVTEIVDVIRDAKREQPTDGKMRYLGVTT